MYSSILLLILVSDPLPFQYLGKHRELCRSACFVDVDYPPLMRRKMELIQANPALRDLVPDLIVNDANNPLVAHSKGYAALACDLRHLDKLGNLLRQQFDCENRAVAFLFVAEVSVAYMERQHADELLCWAATFKDGMLNNLRDPTYADMSQLGFVCLSSICRMAEIIHSQRPCSNTLRSSGLRFMLSVL